MKKYIEPKTICVEVSYEGVIAGSLKGDGLNVTINNNTVTGDADSKESMVSDGSSIWGDEEE